MSKKLVSLLLLPFLLFYALPIQAQEKEERTWQDESIYFLMIDRFNNGNPKNDFDINLSDPKAYHGGDFQGITDRLDYIKDMGFTAIWLTPIVKNEPGGYHGYWTEDFYDVEENFGTMDDFKKLVKEAHNRDMKVIVDLVVNHTGYQHPWLTDPTKKDWFHEPLDITDWNNQEQVENRQLFGLPDLAQENPEVRKYLLDMAKWWITETDIDGYRLDTMKHVPKSFWTEFSKEVKSVKKDFFLLGEVWHDDPNYVADYQKAGIDALVDYPFYNRASQDLSKVDQSLGFLYTTWERNQRYYEDPYMLGTFLDNHDNERFTRKALNNQENPGKRLKVAISYLLTAPGIPIMYYGTEIALDGGNDPDNRRIMDFRTDKELIDQITKLLELRNDLPSLRRGSFELLYDNKGMIVLKRKYKEETSVIAINNTSKTQTVELKAEDLAPDMELRGLLGGDLVRADNDTYQLISERETAEVYVLANKTGINWGFIAAIIVVWVLFGGFIFLLIKRRKRLQTN